MNVIQTFSDASQKRPGARFCEASLIEVQNEEPEAPTCFDVSASGRGLAAARRLVVVSPLIRGELFVILLLHFVLDDGVPAVVSLFRRHVVFSRPATQLKL